MEDKILVGLDIGTTKIGVIIAVVDENFDVDIIGIGTAKSDGLKKGVIVHLDDTVKSIQKAIQEAETISGISVGEVIVGIAGSHIKSADSKGIVTVSRNDNQISDHDVQRCMEQASTINIPEDREIIHVIPQNYVVDEQLGIRNPVGMCGVKLQSNVHVVTVASSYAQNIYNAIRAADIETQEIVLEPLASSYAVLHDDERELGCAVIDMGGGTTDAAVYLGESLKYTTSIEFGGANVTSDLAFALRTPLAQAEEIKRKYGACEVADIEEESIQVPGVGGARDKEVDKSFIAKVIRARMQEMFQMLAKDLKRQKVLNHLGAGIILTGGGSLCKGADKLAEEVFGVPVKVGYPKQLKGLYDSISTPQHATGVGLILYGLENMKQNNYTSSSKKSGDGVMDSVRKIANWMKNYI